MKVKKIGASNKLTSTEYKNEWLDEAKVNEVAIAKYIRVVSTNKRQGSVKTKDRSEVSGGGRKPWRQKGTGRARHGSNRSPIWVGGGVTFGPDGNRNYSLSMNKKEKNLAIASILKKQIEDEKLVTSDLSKVNQTKKAAEIVNAVRKSGKTLIVTDSVAARNAFSNISDTFVTNSAELSGYDLATRSLIIFDESAFKSYLEKRS